MRGFGIYCVIGVVLAGSAACGGGKTEEARQAAATAQAAKEAAGSGEADVAKGMQEFAKAMEQLQQSPDGKAYEPVPASRNSRVTSPTCPAGKRRSRQARA